MALRTKILDAVAGLFRPASKDAPPETAAKLPPDVPAAVKTPERPTWVYQLQNVKPSLIGACGATYAVVDATSDGVAGRWSRTQMAAMRGSKQTKLLAYISIGEAEDYRPYWATARRSPWLDKENPDWPGNYKVKFWHPEWQKIVLDQLTTIVETGFDGAYLDIVDAFDYYNRPDDMVDFVIKIAKHCRALKPGFLVFPQNADALLEIQRYRDTIDGLGREDWLYGEEYDGRKNDSAGVFASRARMAMLIKAGKPVLSVEYLDAPMRAERTIAKATHGENGFSLLIVPRRELDVPICPT